jgi:hypothetical protein
MRGSILKEPDMARLAPVAQVDLTEPSAHLTYAEILTPGGTVQVNANLVDTRTGQPVVVVNITPNAGNRLKTAGGGDWAVEITSNRLRTDVRLVRKDDPGHR